MGEQDALVVAPDKDNIVAFIKEELEKVNHDAISLDENTDMTSDLSVDSLAVMDLMFAIEERFDVSISLNDLADVKTIGQLAGLVHNHAA